MNATIDIRNRRARRPRARLRALARRLLREAVLFVLPVCAVVLGTAPAWAQPEETDAGIRLRLVGYGEGARDFGTAGMDEREESYLELNPEGHWRMSEHFAAHARLQGFFSTGEVILNEDDRPVESDRYGKVRELWLEYGGLTSYPGEVLRFGLQRVRDDDGLWWDRDLESLRWIFNTTIFQAHFGIGEQFDTYRTDDVELSPSQRDRAYAFMSLARDWLPGHRSRLRIAYAQDHGEQPDIGDTADTRSKLAERKFAWLGVSAENGFHEYRRVPPFAYWAEATVLLGTEDRMQTDPTTNAVLTEVSRDVAALAGDVGARWRLAGPLQLQLGAAYAYAQGGRSDDSSHQFQQTGLHSNRSRFTGTRSLMHRFNDAYQADFTNLRVASVFVSVPQEKYDVSLVFQNFSRDDSDAGVSTDGVDVQPTRHSRDLGQGWDLVAAYYLERPARGVFGSADSDEDLRSNIRLRVATFAPGAAYGSGADDQYRVSLEAGLWF